MAGPALWSEQPPVSILIAQAIGLTASGFLWGANTNISYSFVPTILQAPAPLAAQQWEETFHNGHKIGPALAVAGSLATAYVAYHQDPSSLAFKLNVAATILFPSIIPFTLLAIVPTNNKLFAKNKSLAGTSLEDKAIEAGVVHEETTHALIEKWGKLHLARSCLTGIGFVLALWAAIDKREAVGYSGFGFNTQANRI